MAEEIKEVIEEVDEEEIDEKEKKYIKPVWLPWVILGAELAACIVIGIFVCRAAMM